MWFIKFILGLFGVGGEVKAQIQRQQTINVGKTEQQNVDQKAVIDEVTQKNARDGINDADPDFLNRMRQPPQ